LRWDDELARPDDDTNPASPPPKPSVSSNLEQLLEPAIPIEQDTFPLWNHDPHAPVPFPYGYAIVRRAVERQRGTQKRCRPLAPL
jgi:hypothetical protein